MMPATLMTAAKRCKHGDTRAEAMRALVAAALRMVELDRQLRGEGAFKVADRGELHAELKSELGRCFGAAIRFPWVAKADIDVLWRKSMREIGAKHARMNAAIDEILNDDAFLGDDGSGAVERVMRMAVLLSGQKGTPSGVPTRIGQINQLAATARQFHAKNKKNDAVAMCLSVMNVAAAEAHALGLGASALWSLASGRRTEPIV